MGEITVGAVAFNVTPSGRTSVAPPPLPPGDVGVSDAFEHAIARASTAAAEQRTNLFWYIFKEPLLLIWGPLGRPSVGE